MTLISLSFTTLLFHCWLKLNFHYHKATENLNTTCGCEMGCNHLRSCFGSLLPCRTSCKEDFTRTAMRGRRQSAACSPFSHVDSVSRGYLPCPGRSTLSVHLYLVHIGLGCTVKNASRYTAAYGGTKFLVMAGYASIRYTIRLTAGLRLTAVCDNVHDVCFQHEIIYHT